MRVTDRQLVRKEVPRALWGAAVRCFAKRNRGRRTWVRVESPDGTGHRVADGPLLHAGFCPVCDEVELRLGDAGAPYGHYTHAVWNVDAIERALDGEGEETGLDLVYGSGRTTLRIAPADAPGHPLATRLATAVAEP